MTGPNGSGKTTLLYKLKLDEVVETVPTTHCANMETIDYKNVQFTIADIGGFDMWRFRPFIQHHFRRASAFVFVVDSSDQNRALIDDVREVLADILKYLFLQIISSAL
ncbi:Small GTPase superfamily, partial [Aphelenchoides avenae]